MVKQEQSLSQLFSELSAGTSALIRQEVQLAKAEMTQKVSKMGKSVAAIAVGGFILYAGFLVLLGAIAVGLSYIMAPWLATLIVAIVTLGTGGIIIFNAIGTLKDTSVAPERTIETLKEDKEWLQQQVA